MISADAAREELWKESVAAYHERQEAEMRTAWCEYHQGQAARLSGALGALVAHHQAEAEKYRNQLTKEGPA